MILLRVKDEVKYFVLNIYRLKIIPMMNRCTIQSQVWPMWPHLTKDPSIPSFRYLKNSHGVYKQVLMNFFCRNAMYQF